MLTASHPAIIALNPSTNDWLCFGPCQTYGPQSPKQVNGLTSPPEGLPHHRQLQLPHHTTHQLSTYGPQSPKQVNGLTSPPECLSHYLPLQLPHHKKHLIS